MEKTRDLFKKIRDTKGTFHAKMGTIKDRNGMDQTEAEDIKKRRQEYTEELYKKNLCLSLTFDFAVCEKFITVEFSSYYQMIVNYNWLLIA